MSTWNEEEDDMGFAGLVPTAAEKRAEKEEASRLARENEKLNMAYAEGRADERAASHVDELVAILSELCSMNGALVRGEMHGYAIGSPMDRRWKKAEAILAKVKP